MADLELVPIHELIVELTRRSEHGVIMLAVREDGRIQIHESTIGDPHYVAGLGIDAAMWGISEARSRAKHLDGGE